LIYIFHKVFQIKKATGGKMSGRKLMMAWEPEFRIVAGIMQVLSPVQIKQTSFTEEVVK
jgi:hypothetical protein